MLRTGSPDIEPGTAAAVDPDLAGTVVVVDDDPMVLKAMSSLFRSLGLETVLHAAADGMLEMPTPPAPACVLMDIRMPGLGGLDVQKLLTVKGETIPVIFITGHGDVPMSVTAMKAGAVDFLPKPFRDEDVIAAVRTALLRDRDRTAVDAVQARYRSLTPREREVLTLVCDGLMNKQIAGKLGLSEITVKLHRGSMMRKMGVRMVADLVKLVRVLDLPSAT
ncbi:response regulator transcription factor [Sphingomonas arantia]|uniref:Response regulator transcription factor n=1 Tax=Sphingomonas arantia TaxID=1460676 RepID=A0ABW4TZF7_9SPHN